MLWRRVIIASIASAVAVMSTTYYLLNKRLTVIEGQMLLVTTLPTTLHHLSEQLNILKEISFPKQPATLAHVNELQNELTTHLTTLDTQVTQLHTALKELTTQLRVLQQIPIPPHPASIEKVIELHDKLKNSVTAALQVNREYDAQLDIQINDVRNMLANLLNTVKLKQEEMNQFVPVGTVVAYSGVINSKVRELLYQSRWLVCDGSALSIAKYPALYTTIKDIYGNSTTAETFNIPDFRGVFLRGLDAGKQIDPNRLLGSYQADQNQSHNHIGHIKEGGLHTHEGQTKTGGAHQHRLQANGYWFTAKNYNERRAITNEIDDNQEYWTTEDGTHSHAFHIDTSGSHSHELTIDASGGDESRPKNYPVTYLIRF